MRPITIVLCILYILSPIDFIPDLIPFLGWLDDLGVLAYLVTCLITGQRKEGGRTEVRQLEPNELADDEQNQPAIRVISVTADTIEDSAVFQS